MTGTWEPLSHPAFRLLVGARAVALTGNALAPIALAFAVLDLTGSATDLGLVVGARSLANIVLLLFGGVVADRLPRQLVLVGSSATAMVSQAVVATLLLTGSAAVPLLMAVSAANGAAAAVSLPASSALVAQTVPEQLLQRANAVNRMVTGASMMLGAAAGGVVVATVGPAWGIAVDALTFGAAAALYSRIRVAPVVREQSPGVLRDLRDGWREFRRHGWVWAVTLGAMVFNAVEVGAVAVLGPVVADSTFGRPLWGVFLACETAGMVLGALVASRLRVRRLLAVGVLGLLGASLWLFALALAPVPAVMFPAAFLTGVAIEQFGVAWEVSVQEHIPADRLARVYSYDALGSFLAIPVGQVAAGPVADHLGARQAILGGAVLMVVACAAILLHPAVRSLQHRVAVPAVPACVA